MSRCNEEVSDMKKKFYILMCLASLVLMVTACGGKEKIKEKLRAATEAVKERKEAAASEKGSDLEMDKLLLCAHE